MAEAKITFVRLRSRSGNVAGSLAPEFGNMGNRSISRVALGEIFPVLVESLPSGLRAEYDAWEKAQVVDAPAPVPTPEVSAPAKKAVQVKPKAEEAPDKA